MLNDGFPPGPVTAQAWSQAARIYAQTNRAPNSRPGSSTFAPSGRGPHAGEVWALPDHAATLRRIAESHAEDFYQGELAARIASFAAETGGY